MVQGFSRSGPRALVLDPSDGRVLERIKVREPALPRPPTEPGGDGPGGARLVVRSSDGQATLGIAPPGGSPREVARVSGPPGYAFWEPTWSPDGEWILVRDSNRNLLVVRAREEGGLRLLVERVSGPFAWHVPGYPGNTVELDSLRAGR